MLFKDNKLFVFEYDGSSYTDYSNQALDYARSKFQITITTSGSLYVGFVKPINVFYTELIVGNENGGTLSLAYYNGSTFTAVSGLFDETENLNRSGFISWDRNQTSEAKTTINSQEAYWYKIDTTVTQNQISICGLNIVFSDDNDLKKEYFEIENWLPSGQASHILSHVASRDHIIQDLRRDGRFKFDFNTGKIEQISAFDLLDISQVKVASTYLTLSKIFNNISDEIDDVHRQKSDYYMKLFNNAMNAFFLDLDTDDDGIQDNEERYQDNTGKVLRR